MHLTYRNVNSAFAGLVRDLHQGNIPTVREPSRNGNVLRIPEPLIVTYTHPRERVLFNQARDCNPFFHLYESLWMLAGRNDVASLVYYNSKMAEFSDDGKTTNGAYGYRWRHAARADYDYKSDQIKLIVHHLRCCSQSRRAVLNMWNVDDDLMKIDSSKDVCCNLNVMFSIRTESQPALTEWRREAGHVLNEHKYLDMTVTNRSNDLILGMLGANVVHFSMLQEYVAACVGVEVGVYNQFTNNGHVYEWNWEPEKWLKDTIDHYRIASVLCSTLDERFPLIKDPATFDRECAEFVMEHANGDNPCEADWEEPFLHNVAQPMMMAFHNHKWREYATAKECVAKIKADDWRIAAGNWINKRKANWSKRQAGRGESLQVGD